MHANTIETTANQQGWTLHTGFAGGQWLETSSPAGEDLIIDVPSGRPIPETVHEHAEQFDPDEHVRALVRSPMKGQPGTIAELLEDAKAIQTMLDRLDAALSAFAAGLLALGLERGERVGIYLDKRPETVTADGRVQAWLAGSGTDASERSFSSTCFMMRVDWRISSMRMQ